MESVTYGNNKYSKAIDQPDGHQVAEESSNNNNPAVPMVLWPLWRAHHFPYDNTSQQKDEESDQQPIIDFLVSSAQHDQEQYFYA